MDAAPRDCACGSHPTAAAFSCLSCGRSWSRAVMVSPVAEPSVEIGSRLGGTEARACDYVQRLIAGALSGALTGFFAIGGPQCSLIMEEQQSSQSICCPICLQDFEFWELARSLPHCHHKFHMACVDKWLSGHGSCPICRRIV